MLPGMETTHLSLGDAALEYAQHGWRIFPLAPRSKRPLIAGKDWKKYATDDEAQVVAWWEATPNANIGLLCGEASGVVVLDIDQRGEKDGSAEVRKLEGENEMLPRTPSAATGGGGGHLFFAWPNEVSVGCPKPIKDCEIKGEGGYVVLSPSIHPDTAAEYAWVPGARFDEENLAAIPIWLLDLICRQVDGGPAPEVEPRDLNDFELSELGLALDHISPAIGYEEWIAIGMGIQDATGGSDAGWGLFYDWSCGGEGLTTPSGKAAFRSDRDCRYHWRSFRGGGSNPRGKGTVFAMANENAAFPAALAALQAKFAPQIAEAALKGTPAIRFWEMGDEPELDLDAAMPAELAWLTEYFERIGELYPAPRDFGVVMGLGMASGAIGGRRELLVEGTSWREPSPLWVLVASPSGSGKSPVIKELRRPFDDWDENQRESINEKVEWEVALKQAESAIAGAERRMKGSKGEADPILADRLKSAMGAVELLKSKPPQGHAITVSDMTTPAMVEFLRTHHGRALLLDSEGGVFRFVFGGKSDIEKSADPWLKSYSCEKIQEKRIGGVGGGAERIVHRPILAMAIATQASALDLFENKYAEQKGFLARFLPVTFKYSLPEQFLTRGVIDQGLKDRWGATITSLLAQGRPSAPETVCLKGDAVAVFEAWGQEWLDRARQDPQFDEDALTGFGSSIGAKLRSNALRLMLTLHSLSYPGAAYDSISRDIAERVTNVWMPFFEAHTRRLAAVVGKDENHGIAMRILRWGDRNGLAGREFTRAEVMRSIGKVSRGSIRCTDDLNGGLEILDENGWVAPVGKVEFRAGARVAPRYRFRDELL